MLALAPLSVVRDYTIIDVTDDALVPPAVAPAPSRLPDEDDTAWAARLAAAAEVAATTAEAWRETYDRACETGRWDGLLVAGKTPTVFHVRQIGISAWAAFQRVIRTLGQPEIAQLAFRLAVVGIDNLPLPVKLTRAPHAEPALGDALPAEVVDAIGSAEGGRDVVFRVGLAILRQRGAPLGK